MAMIYWLFIVLSGMSNGEILDAKPMEFVESFSEEATPVQVETWQELRTSLAENNTHLESIRRAVEDMTQSRAVLMVDGTGFTASLSLPSGTQMHAVMNIPYPNLLTVMATTMNTLLDGLGPDVIYKQLKDIEFSKDVVIPKSLLHTTILELFNRLPQYNYDQIGLVNEMNVQARTAFLAIRDILGKNFRDGWHDAFLSVSLDNATLGDQDNVEVTLNDLVSFTKSIVVEFKSAKSAENSNKLPNIIRGNNYAFGWWINCEKGQSCLTGILPRDAVISFSPTLRIYIIPSIGTGFIISNTVQRGHNARTMRNWLNFDTELFTRMLRALHTDPTTISSSNDKDVPGEGKVPTDEGDNEDDDGLDAILGTIFRTIKTIVIMYMDFVAGQHVVIRALLWVGFLLLAHVVTSWIYHGVWLVLTRLVKQTHEPRPKRD